MTIRFEDGSEERLQVSIMASSYKYVVVEWRGYHRVTGRIPNCLMTKIKEAGDPKSFLEMGVSTGFRMQREE